MLKKYFTFSLSHRIGRIKYFLSVFIVGLLAFVAIGLGRIFGPLSSIFVVGLLCIDIILTIQRLNDIGRSRWFVVLLFVPYVNIVVYLACLFIPSKWSKAVLERIETE